MCVSGIKTTETLHGHQMPTPSLSSTGLSWLQDWPLSSFSRYEADKSFTILVYTSPYNVTVTKWDVFLLLLQKLMVHNEKRTGKIRSKHTHVNVMMHCKKNIRKSLEECVVINSPVLYSIEPGHVPQHAGCMDDPRRAAVSAGTAKEREHDADGFSAE